MKDISNKLPIGIFMRGVKLYEIDFDTRKKFIIKDEERNYRAFLYKNKNDDDSSASVYDLCEAYVYDSGIGSSLILQGKPI